MRFTRVMLAIVACSALASSVSAQSSASHPPGNANGSVVSPSFPSPQPKAPNTYGTDFTSYRRVGFTEFSPIDSTTTYSDFSASSFTFSRFPTANPNLAFMAVPYVPSGALVTSVEFDWCDSNLALDATLNVYSSSYSGAGGTLLGTVNSSGDTGCGFSTADVDPDFQMDNFNNQLVLVAFVPATDGSMGISGAIVHYRLQVSPAPVAASFLDVPLGHPQFQWIEALVASGITAGCGGGNYCPGASLTRGQMAVFLAKALGLQFN